MADEWIIDVLEDLGEFARKNGLRRLAAQIDASTEVARYELATLGCVHVGEVTRDTGSARPDPQRAQYRGHA